MSQQTFREFSIGEVLGKSFEILFRNIVSFGVIAIVFYAIPIALVTPSIPVGSLGDVPSVAGTDGLPDAATGTGALGGMFFSAVFVLLLFMLLYFFVAATFVHGTLQDLRGGRASIGDCLNRALVVAIPVAMVAVLSSIAIMIGLMFFFIPGLFIMVMLYVAIPVAVIERPGIMASLSRSAELTKGYRGHLFVMIVVLLVFNMVVNGIWAGIVPFTGVMGIPVSMAIDAFFTALYAVVGTVTYVALRHAKEGADVSQIAAQAG